MNKMLKSSVLIVVFISLSGIVIGGTLMKNKWPPKLYTLTKEIKDADKVMKITYPRDSENPDSEILQKRLSDAITLLEKEESIITYLLKNDLVKKSEWNGRYSGYILFKSPRIGYFYEFTNDFKAIYSVTKEFYDDKTYRKHKKTNTYLVFYPETESIKYFTYGDFPQSVELSLYKNKRLKDCRLSIGNKYYDCKWDGDGKLLSTETSPIPIGLLEKHKQKQVNSKTNE